MSEEIITYVSVAEALTLDSKRDWSRFDALPDNEDEEDFDASNSEVFVRPGKNPVSIRLDDDVLAFFKSDGKGYQTRINAVLRSYMQAKKAG